MDFQYPTVKREYQLSGIKTISLIANIQGPSVPTWDGAVTKVIINPGTLIGPINSIHLNIMAAITGLSTVMDMGTTQKEGITTRVIMDNAIIDKTNQSHHG